jgi:antitoxin (DNA-binding transcriptional repressor) of toxin-antitoxin stability system
MRPKKHMLISVVDAKQQLTDLVRRAGAGDEVVLTGDGKAVARLAQITTMPTAIDRGPSWTRCALPARNQRCLVLTRCKARIFCTAKIAAAIIAVALTQTWRSVDAHALSPSL